MRDQRVFLKVKIKSLMAEARIIRHETKRAPRALRSALSDHRRGIVRTAARNTLLAYGFLRGRTYGALESKCAAPPNWKEVERMVSQYGVAYAEGMTGEQHRAAKAEQAERLQKWMPPSKAQTRA